VSGFSAEWLALREPADHVARSESITQQLATWVQSQNNPIVVTDLGAGAGSNFRYLAPQLGHEQRWQLIDHDEMLLAALPQTLRRWAQVNDYKINVHDEGSGQRNNHSSASDSAQIHIAADHFSAQVSCLSMDLSDDLASLKLPKSALVTASALLDLTSAHWIDKLIERCHENACATLFALNYDGRIKWRPSLTGDEQVTSLLNQHQQQDKGLGLALGPHAGEHAAQRLTQSGFDVSQHTSDWIVDSASVKLQSELATGWADAALEMNSGADAVVSAWLQQRRELCDAGLSQLTVGHLDVLGLPPPD